jgi:hypothetical protein
MLTLDALAEELAVDPGDVAVLASQLLNRLPEQKVPDHVAAALRQQLDPNGERTVPSRYWAET